jgi:hypothetical protein
MSIIIKQGTDTFKKYKLQESAGDVRLRLVEGTGNQYRVLHRLVESVVVNTLPSEVNDIVALAESIDTPDHMKLQEGKDGVKRKCLASYKVPISKYSENENGRIYPKKLWERVHKEQMGNNAFGLVDHPPDDSYGSNKDTFCVWEGMEVGKDHVYMNMHLFGEWGKHIKAGMDAGGNQGFSSVGYGEMDEDGKTVIAETFELDRPSDAVLNPSQLVFGNASMEFEEDGVEYIKEGKEMKDEKIVEDINKKQNVPLSETEGTNSNIIEKETPMSEKLDVAKYKRETRKAFKEAIKSTDKKEALAEVISLKEEIVESGLAEKDITALIVEADKAVESINADIEATLKEQADEIARLKEEKEKSEQKLQMADIMMDKLKEKYSKVTEFSALVQKENMELKEEENLTSVASDMVDSMTGDDEDPDGYKDGSEAELDNNADGSIIEQNCLVKQKTKMKQKMKQKMRKKTKMMQKSWTKHLSSNASNFAL